MSRQSSLSFKLDLQGTTRVSTRDVLLDLGFAEDNSEQMRGFSCSFGSFKLWALPCTNRWFADVVLLTAVIRPAPDCLTDFQDEMPAELESAEQVKAWLADRLDDAAGEVFRQRTEPAWLVEGRANKHLLPWVRQRLQCEREQAEYGRRPHCYVSRDWLKLALKKLSKLVPENESQAVSLAYDQGVLRLTLGDRLISAVPADGSVWPEGYEVGAAGFHRVPRFRRDPVDVSVWRGRLFIGGTDYGPVISKMR
jgi:hypothetical protein